MVLQGLYSVHTICGVILILFVIYGTWLFICKLAKSESNKKSEENIVTDNTFNTIVEIAKREIGLFLAEKKISQLERKTKQLEGKVNNSKYQSYVIQTEELKQNVEKHRNNLEELKIVLKNKENFNEIIPEEEVKIEVLFYSNKMDENVKNKNIYVINWLE